MTTVEQKRGRVLARVGFTLVLFHVLFLLLAIGWVWLDPTRFNQKAYYGNFHWPREAPPTVGTSLATWDAQHYLFLADQGYSAGRRSIAFFPLFPWLIRAVASLPGVDPAMAALAIANVLSIAGCLLLYRFVDQRYPGAGAAKTLVLLLAFPGALFLHFPYTESLFLFLAVATIAAVAQDRFLLAATPAFLLALTRPNGILIGAALLYAALSRWRREGWLQRRQRAPDSVTVTRAAGAEPRPETSPLAPLIALAAPLLGFLVYLLFMRVSTGNAFAGFDMQDAYNARRSLGNLLHPFSILRDLVDVRAFHGVLHSFVDRAVFLFVIAMLVPLWRLDRLLFWYALPMALIGPLSGSFVSYTRFAAILFPCHLVIARATAAQRRRPLLWLTVAIFAALQLYLLLRHVSFRWAG